MSAGEPERYELEAARPVGLAPTRRLFLKQLGAGLVIVAAAPRLLAQLESGSTGRRGRRALPVDIDAWVRIDARGQITFFTGKTEVGQNIRTSLTQVVAEELPAPLSDIHLVMADTDLTPYDAGTFGSRTTPDMGPLLRRAAATAREALFEIAAVEWKLPASELKVEDGKVVHPSSGRAVPYGDLTKGRRLQRGVAENPPLKKPEEWTVAGRSIPKVNGRLFVTGAHHYTSDLTFPGMLHGRVLRPPSYGAVLETLDSSDAEQLPGVKIVQDGTFVAVAAPSANLAAKAIAAIKSTWKPVPQVSDGDLFAHLRKTSEGSLPSATAAAGGRQVRSHYEIAYIAHAPLEPRAAVARWQHGKLEVWTGTQRPFGVREDIARELALNPDKVRVIVPDTGSAYGGKHTGDAAIEAARLAQACQAPVRVVWTREEEFTWAYFRPGGVIDVAAELDAEGNLASWTFHNVNSGNAGIRAPYRVGKADTQFHRAQSPLRQGSYRALASTANHFARESHIDELARVAQVDPLAFRLRHLNDARATAVLEAAALRFDWAGRGAGDGKGHGLAVGTEKGSFVATCVEIALEPGAPRRYRVTRIVQAFECGAIINPAHVISQNQGCILQGLGGALFEAVRFEDGRILNPRFSSYRVPRFSDVPPIDIVLLNRPDLPSVGAGETPIVTLAPAIANAVAAATGVRLRRLPLGEVIPEA